MTSYLSPAAKIAEMTAGMLLPRRSTAPWDQPWRGTITTIDPNDPADVARLTKLVVWRETPARDGRVTLHIAWPNPSYTAPAPDEPWYDFRGRLWTEDQKASWRASK